MNLATYSVPHFDRGASRFKEVLWIIVRGLFFLPSWPLPSSWRVSLLRLFGTRVGQRVVIRSRVNITFPWRLEIGDHVWIGEEVLILSLAPVRLGSHVCLSQRAFLCTGTHDYRRADFALQTKPIIVEDSCWIAAQAFIGPGVTIGAGSVIAAGAVVVRSVPPQSLVRGNPAEVVGSIERENPPVPSP